MNIKNNIYGVFAFGMVMASLSLTSCAGDEELSQGIDASKDKIVSPADVTFGGNTNNATLLTPITLTVEELISLITRPGPTIGTRQLSLFHVPSACCIRPPGTVTSIAARLFSRSGHRIAAD